jgi:hypothetical protein
MCHWFLGFESRDCTFIQENDKPRVNGLPVYRAANSSLGFAWCCTHMQPPWPGVTVSNARSDCDMWRSNAPSTITRYRNIPRNIYVLSLFYEEFWKVFLIWILLVSHAVFFCAFGGANLISLPYVWNKQVNNSVQLISVQLSSFIRVSANSKSL